MQHRYRNIIVFGLTLGSFLAIYVIIGTFFWRLNLKTEIIKNISHAYTNYREGTLGILIGSLWAFLDGFIVGATLMYLYQQVYQMVKNR
ncbi:MAG: hypothetical protein HUU50_08590 [Candidatus Brocadiae bacterium]|nr:hypothetical protein [Candidatus Brocadiia bacterium]